MQPTEPSLERDVLFEQYIETEAHDVQDSARRAYYASHYERLFPEAFARYETDHPSVIGVAVPVHTDETMFKAEAIVDRFERANLKHVQQYFGISW